MHGLPQAPRGLLPPFTLTPALPPSSTANPCLRGTLGSRGGLSA